jgi:hypothetical protein
LGFVQPFKSFRRQSGFIRIGRPVVANFEIVESPVLSSRSNRSASEGRRIHCALAGKLAQRGFHRRPQAHIEWAVLSWKIASRRSRNVGVRPVL